MELFQAFVDGLNATTALEFIAVLAGIGSVLLSRAEHVLVYPVGLVNTVIYIYLSFKGHLLGEASVNLYYTLVSIWGWWLWTRRTTNNELSLQISFSTGKEWVKHLSFFAVCYAILFFALQYLKNDFAPGAIPWADGFAAATAYTAMWLMARKKLENWIWWIATDLASIPLYFVKGYVFSSFQFLVFTILAIMGLISWWKKAKRQNPVQAITLSLDKMHP
ncbi:MAG: nicotinamide mononucleotide transporter [Bacteroidetes bacterium]|nr:nicotinamide mononucleotide transporter [Bacteroidota bacterium]